jgi:hypothetical protein
MKKIFLPLVVILLLSACGTPSVVTPTATPPPTVVPPTARVLPTVTPVCVSTEPTQDDIDSALAYTGDLFSEPDWQSSYSVSEGRVAVTWNSDTLGGAAYLEALIFPCGYEEPDLNNYFNDGYWRAIFDNYESYELVSECKADSGVRLYQFKTVSQGFDYDVKYWAENDTDSLVMALMLAFPVESNSLMDEYSADLFPELSNCTP